MGINIQVFYFSSEEMKQFAKSKCGMVFFFFLRMDCGGVGESCTGTPSNGVWEGRVDFAITHHLSRFFFLCTK